MLQVWRPDTGESKIRVAAVYTLLINTPPSLAVPQDGDVRTNAAMGLHIMWISKAEEDCCMSILATQTSTTESIVKIGLYMQCSDYAGYIGMETNIYW